MAPLLCDVEKSRRKGGPQPARHEILYGCRACPEKTSPVGPSAKAKNEHGFAQHLNSSSPHPGIS